MATWSTAFAEQADSDLDTYNLLAKSNLPSSYRLHYLQMWLEKLCKAYLYVPGAGDPERRFKHKVIEEVLPKLISKYWSRTGFEHRPDTTQIRRLCREIDLLHPQVDDDNRRPDNVEYPWAGASGGVEVPAKWKYFLTSSLNSHPGRMLLKAATILTRNSALFIR